MSRLCLRAGKDRISQNDRIDKLRRRAHIYTRFITIMPATNAGHAYYVLKIGMEYYAVFRRTRRKANALSEGRGCPFLPFVTVIIRETDVS